MYMTKLKKKNLVLKIVEIIKDMPYEYWSEIKDVLDQLYYCNNLKNTLNGNKDISKIIDRSF